MNLWIKPKKWLVREKPESLVVPQTINQVGSMDFMHDELADGRSFRLFNALDDFSTAKGWGIEVDLSFPGEGLNKSIFPVFCASNPLNLKVADLEGLTCSGIP